MKGYLALLLEERRSSPRNDLLTRLTQAEVDGERLTDYEILGFFQLLLVAGAETTTNLLNNAIICFAEHPGELARLRAAPELLSSAIEEVLRYRSPVQWFFRATTKPVELHGETIPAGKLVLPLIGSANRDPKYFTDPQRFDIARDPNPHIAFGHGIHFCIGARTGKAGGAGRTSGISGEGGSFRNHRRTLGTQKGPPRPRPHQTALTNRAGKANRNRLLLMAAAR